MPPAFAGDHAKSKWGYLTGDVRQKNMPSATVHLESHADRQETWCDSVTIRTTEASQQEYPEAEITVTATPGREASCHSKYIPEARREMISGFPHPALAMRRPKRENFCSMQPQAVVVGSRSLRRDQRRQFAALRAGSSRLQATFHAPLDHETKYANEPVDLIPVPSGLSAYLLLIPLRGQEVCRKQAGIGHWGR